MQTVGSCRVKRTGSVEGHRCKSQCSLFFIQISCCLCCYSIPQGWESSGFRQNPGFLVVPRVILEILLNLGRTFLDVYYIYIMITAASCWCRALQPRSCLPFYPNSVCPDLDWQHMIWNWPCLAHVCISWRLASKNVAGKNRLVKFCNTIFTSCA